MRETQTGEHEQRAVEEFLFLEARLLDHHEYDAWLELWTMDADTRYWVPGACKDVDPSAGISIIYDDREQLNDRVFRLQHPASHAFAPRPHVARVVSNIECRQNGRADTVVDSAYILVANRQSTQSVVGARVRHVLALGDGHRRIREKKVVLTAAGVSLRNLSFLP